MFTSSRFDVTSDLPEDDNAGNRFYGRDLAAYLCEQLGTQGLKADYLDEDWGWLVLGSAGPSTTFEIAVYHLLEDGNGAGQGAPEWGLWMRAFQRKKLLGILPKKERVGVPPRVEAAVLDAIAQIGASPRDWVDGPAE